MDELLAISRQALAAWERNKNGRKNQDFDLLNDPVTDTLRNKITELMNQDSDVQSRESQPLNATQAALRLIEDKRKILTEEKIKLLEAELSFLVSPVIAMFSISTPVLLFNWLGAAAAFTASGCLTLVAAVVVALVIVFFAATVRHISNRIHNERNLKAVDLIEAALNNPPYQPNNRVSSLSPTKKAHSESTASSHSSTYSNSLLRGDRRHLQIDWTQGRKGKKS
jgi:uncharacterized membrane protein YciS (DUF1049 family)